METMVIRMAKHPDIPQLINFRMESISKEFNCKLFTKKKAKIENYFVKHLHNDLEVYIAESNKVIIAIVCLSYLTLLPRIVSNNNKSAYLSYYYIKSEYDAKWLKKNLFRKVVERAKKQKAEVFELAVSKAEIPAYMKYGFAESEFLTLNMKLENNKCGNNINTNFAIFRKAENGDIQSLVDMRTQFLYEVSNSKENVKEAEFRLRLAEFLEEHLNRDVEAFIAEKSSRIISVCFTIYFEIIIGNMGLPVNAYTLPNFRGQGIAKSLFAYSLEYAEKRGTELLETQIPKKSYAFYNKFGFELSELTPIQLRL